MYLLRIKCSAKTYIIQIQVKRTNKKGEMQSKDKTTIKKTKVMHVYISTTVLSNDIQILRFISYRDSDRELVP